MTDQAELSLPKDRDKLQDGEPRDGRDRAFL